MNATDGVIPVGGLHRSWPGLLMGAGVAVFLLLGGGRSEAAWVGGGFWAHGIYSGGWSWAPEDDAAGTCGGIDPSLPSGVSSFIAGDTPPEPSSRHTTPESSRRTTPAGCCGGAEPGVSTSLGHGMPVWRVQEPLLSFWLEDVPLAYQPPRGIPISYELYF